ncbi:MAG: hypothetical protein J0L75_09495 [Spirochaetes bacterium]|nr:hypothetical protein [Spirochaetota bacterium]
MKKLIVLAFVLFLASCTALKNVPAPTGIWLPEGKSSIAMVKSEIWAFSLVGLVPFAPNATENAIQLLVEDSKSKGAKGVMIIGAQESLRHNVFSVIINVLSILPVQSATATAIYLK